MQRERLQAITDKRRVQEVIAQKKQEIDKEKLKLQHLKKKALRDQWLMDGSAAQSSQQKQSLKEDQLQTRLLQSSIHRIEKEIEVLEREESMISTNEGFILKKLRAVEKSPEDIIREAKKNFKDEPLNLRPGISEAPLSYRPLNSRLLSDRHTDGDEPKQTLFAMEINVQKDLRTGENRVISTATVTPQELQQRGVKVYDDGRKCVYAMRCNGPVAEGGRGLESHGVDELSSREVEQLLRAATERKHQRAAPCGNTSRGHQRELSISGRGQSVVYPPTSRGSREQTFRQCSHRVNGHQQSHDYSQEALSRMKSYQNSANHIPARSHISREDEFYQPISSLHHQQQGVTPSFSDLYRFPATNQPSTIFYDSTHRERCPSPLYEDDAPYRILNTQPANSDASEPITAIFMGYQTAEDDSGRGLGYEGSIKAELVVIDDEYGDGAGDPGPPEGNRSHGYVPGRNGAELEAGCNGDNARRLRRPWRQDGRTDRRQREGRTDGLPGSDIQMQI